MIIIEAAAAASSKQQCRAWRVKTPMKWSEIPQRGECVKEYVCIMAVVAYLSVLTVYTSRRLPAAAAVCLCWILKATMSEYMRLLCFSALLASIQLSSSTLCSSLSTNDRPWRSSAHMCMCSFLFLLPLWFSNNLEQVSTDVVLCSWLVQLQSLFYTFSSILGSP